MNAPTFRCTWCGAPIHGQLAGAVIDCPYCHARVTVPYPDAGGGAANPQGAGGGVVLGPGVVIHGNVQIGGGQLIIGRQNTSSDPNLTASAYQVLTHVDPKVGPIVIGPHAPDGQPARLRALVIREKRALWEALAGERFLSEMDVSNMTIVGPNLYVSWKRQLIALDLATGAKKWAIGLPDEIETNWGEGGPPAKLAIADPFPPGQRGAILVATIDHVVLSVDRDSGHVLWQRPNEYTPKFRVAEGFSTVGVLYDSSYAKLDVFNPAFPQPIATVGATEDKWTTDLSYAKVFGRTVVCHAESWPIRGEDDDDADGMVLVDLPTGGVHLFEHVDNLENSDVPPALMGQRVFCAGSNGENYWVGPRGRFFDPPLPGQKVVAFEAAGPVLAVMMTKAHGSSLRRIVGIDPNTLQIRWDTGELSTEPDGDYPHQMATNGYTLAYVNAKNDDTDDYEIVCIDTTSGRVLFKKDIGDWMGHFFRGALLVARTREGVSFFMPHTGEVIGTFPATA